MIRSGTFRFGRSKRLLSHKEEQEDVTFTGEEEEDTREFRVDTLKGSSLYTGGAQRMPHACQFVNNHVLVNRTRSYYGFEPFKRNASLDSLAQERARYLAKREHLESESKLVLRSKIGHRHVAENIARGADMSEIHKKCMDRNELPGHRRNILSNKHNEMGMGTAKSSTGKLYLVQYFCYNPEVAHGA